MAHTEAKTVAYQRRLKRTSRMGAKRTLQKLGENATAVMAAICHSGTCSAANNCGSANNTMPLLNPMVALHIPISQMGGVSRLVFKRTLGCSETRRMPREALRWLHGDSLMAMGICGVEFRDQQAGECFRS